MSTSDPSQRFLEKKEKIEFLTEYQNAIKRLNVYDDFDDQGIDSIYNLLKETLIGSLYWMLFLIGETFVTYESFLNGDHNVMPMFHIMVSKYHEYKKELIEYRY